MEILSHIAEIFVLGVIGGSVPGPVLTSVFTEILNGGFNKGMKVIFRALIAEVVVAGAILFVLSALNVPQLYFEIISLFGAIFLIYLAVNIWKINKIDGENKEIFTFSKIFILTILNGAFWIFWLTVCVPRAFALKEVIVGGQILFLIVFESGWFVMTALLAFIFFKFRPLLLRKDLVSSVFKFFALILVFFAFKSAYESVVYFLK